MLLLHVLAGIVLALTVVNPLARNLHVAGRAAEDRSIRWWARTLCRIIGLRVVACGELGPRPRLVVANHLSWLDIEVLHAHRAMSFVAKAEIRRWPVVGWLARQAGTIFHRRGSSESMRQVAEALTQRLHEGHDVAIFPEARTGPGDHVQVFHYRLFQAAIDTGVAVQPVGLRYRLDGQPHPSVAFRDGESFVRNVLRMLGERGGVAEVIACPEIQPAGKSRRDIAESARASIAEALGLPTSTARAAAVATVS